MIINLRGTSGSGKSTIVRTLMKMYDRVEPTEECQRIVGYTCFRAGNPLYVVGRYTTPCGGCDTLNGMDYIYNFIHTAAGAGKDVIFEGLIVASDTKRCIALKEKWPLLVIELSTPIDICLAGVQARRDARGDTRPLNPSNTKAKAHQVEIQRKHWRAAQIDFRLLSREDAQKVVFAALGFDTTREMLSDNIDLSLDVNNPQEG